MKYLKCIDPSKVTYHFSFNSISVDFFKALQNQGRPKTFLPSINSHKVINQKLIFHCDFFMSNGQRRPLIFFTDDSFYLEKNP